MTKFKTVLLAILSTAVAGALYKFVPEAKELSAGAAMLAAALLGWAKRHPADGTGNFLPLSQTSRGWRGIAAAPNGDVYACVNSGDIYKQTAGEGTSSAPGEFQQSAHAGSAGRRGSSLSR